jgi:hypothetical protein
MKMKKYYEPTHPTVRKVADSVLASTTALTASGIIMGHPALAIGVLLVGAVAKFASNLFAPSKK